MRSARIVALAFLLSGVSAAYAVELVTLSAQGVPVENGKILDMEFREVVRTEDASIVEVTRASGGSVSSSMFVFRGECAVARARGKQYFRSERVPDRPWAYRLTFPSGIGEVDDKTGLSKDGVFSLEQCARVGF